jgi:acylphosphatase
MVCKHVQYSGRVQGVGFRYTAERLAQGRPISGFVRNLPSGDVEVVVEGAVADIDAYLAQLSKTMAGHIERADIREEASGGYQGFRIRF